MNGSHTKELIELDNITCGGGAGCRIWGGTGRARHSMQVRALCPSLQFQHRRRTELPTAFHAQAEKDHVTCILIAFLLSE